MMALLEGRTKEVGKGGTWENVKSKRPCGGVWQGTSWGRDDANTTRPRMTRDGWSAVKCVLDHFLGREKKRKKCISYARSQLFFSEYGEAFLTTAQ